MDKGAFAYLCHGELECQVFNLAGSVVRDATLYHQFAFSVGAASRDGEDGFDRGVGHREVVGLIWKSAGEGPFVFVA